MVNDNVVWGIFVAENTKRFPNFYPIALYSTREKAVEDLNGLPKDINYQLLKLPVNRNFAYYHKKTGRLVSMDAIHHEHFHFKDSQPVICSIKECPGRREAFIAYVSESWPAVKHVVIRQLEESLISVDALPLTFLLLKLDRIIGFYQLIEQEQLVRKDLSPWIAPLFIDEGERGHAYGALLLQHARETAGQLGFNKVYLTTDHFQYYEKYGFREIGFSQFEWGRPSKIYEHDTIK
jgi:GNAT superfamily N-acetyltransferase